MSRIKLIQCGVGGWGAGWAKQRVPESPDFELAAIVDVSPKALADAGDAIGIPAERRFSSLETALDRVSADAVFTVTPPAVHVEHARLAFSRGLHLLTEKPIADTIENAKLMVRLAKESGRQLTVSQNYRFRPAALTLRKLITEKVLGPLGHGHLDFYIAADFTGTFRQTMRFPLLVDMAIHHLDLIRSVTGRNIVRVMAASFNPAWSWYEHDCGLKMILELEGGVPFSYSGDWSARGRFTGWDGEWRLQCEKGDVGWRDGKISLGRSSTWCKDLTIEEVVIQPPPFGEYSYVLHNFAEAIRTGIPAETSGSDNLYSFAAVIAGVRSVEEARAVRVGELLDEC
jgi:predicted dehydrogenase